MERNRFALLVLLCCTIFISFSAATILLFFRAGETPARFFSTGDSGDIAALGDLIVNEQCEVYYRVYYTICGHTVLQPRVQGVSDIIGFNRTQLEQYFLGYTIEEFSEERLVLSCYIEEPCRECQNYAFIGVKDGKVAVFYGRPRPDAAVKKLTEIEVSKLPKEVQAELQKGIEVNNNDLEINAVLEGLER